MPTLKQDWRRFQEEQAALESAPSPEEQARINDRKSLIDDWRKEMDKPSNRRVSSNGRWEEIDGDTIKDRKTGIIHRLGGAADTPETAKHFQGIHGSQQGAHDGTWFDMLEAAGDHTEIVLDPVGKDVHGRDVTRFFIGGRDVARELISTNKARRMPNFDKNGWYKDAEFEAAGKAGTSPVTRRHETPQEMEAQTSNRPIYSGRKYVGNAVAHGIDQMQAMNYAFVEVIGQALDIELLQDWAHEGIMENLLEAARNPAQVKDYTEADGQVGKYVLESIAEEAPQLATDLLALAGSGLTAGAIKMAMGQTLKKGMSKVAYAQLTQRAMKAGAVTSFTTQAVGEVQLELKSQDIEAPFTAMGFGAINTMLDYASAKLMVMPLFDRFKKLSKGGRLTPKTAAMAVGASGARGFTSESLTEMAQTVNSKIAAEINGGKPFTSDEFFTEYIDAGIRGGIVGGAISSASSLLAQLDRKLSGDYTDASGRAHRDMERMANDGPDDPAPPAGGTPPDAGSPAGGSGSGRPPRGGDPDPSTFFDSDTAPESTDQVVEVLNKDGEVVHSESGVFAEKAAAVAAGREILARDGETVQVRPDNSPLSERQSRNLSEIQMKRAGKHKKPYKESYAKGLATKLTKQTGEPHEVVPVGDGFGVQKVADSNQTSVVSESEQPIEELPNPRPTATEIFEQIDQAVLEQTEQPDFNAPQDAQPEQPVQPEAAVEPEQAQPLEQPVQPEAQAPQPEQPDYTESSPITQEAPNVEQTGRDGTGAPREAGEVNVSPDGQPGQTGRSPLQQDDTGATGAVHEGGDGGTSSNALRQALDKISGREANRLVSNYEFSSPGLLDRLIDQYYAVLDQRITPKLPFARSAAIYFQAVRQGYHRKQAAAVAHHVYETQNGADSLSTLADTDLDEVGERMTVISEYVDDDGEIQESFEFSEFMREEDPAQEPDLAQQLAEFIAQIKPNTKNWMMDKRKELAARHPSADFDVKPTGDTRPTRNPYTNRMEDSPLFQLVPKVRLDEDGKELKYLTGRFAVQQEERANQYAAYLKEKFSSRDFQVLGDDLGWHWIEERRKPDVFSGEPRINRTAEMSGKDSDPTTVIRRQLTKAAKEAANMGRYVDAKGISKDERIDRQWLLDKATAFFIPPLRDRLRYNKIVEEGAAETKKDQWVDLRPGADNSKSNRPVRMRLHDITQMGIDLMHDADFASIADARYHGFIHGLSRMLELGYRPVMVDKEKGVHESTAQFDYRRYPNTIYYRTRNHDYSIGRYWQGKNAYSPKQYKKDENKLRGLQSNLRTIESKLEDNTLKGDDRHALVVRLDTVTDSIDKLKRKMALYHKTINLKRDLDNNPELGLLVPTIAELRSDRDLEGSSFESPLKDANGNLVPDSYAFGESEQTKDKPREVDEFTGESLTTGMTRTDPDKPARRVVFTGSTFNAIERRFLDKLLDSLNLDMKVQVFTFKEFYQSPYFDKLKEGFSEFVSPGRLRLEHFDFGAAQDMINRNGGAYFGLNGEAIIVLRDLDSGDMADRGQRMLTMAHELGHAVERHLVGRLSKEQQDSLIKAFNEDKETMMTYHDLDFGEWFADKLAVYLTEKSIKNEEAIASPLKKVAEGLRNFYEAALKQLSSLMRVRLTGYKPFNEMLDEMTAAHGLKQYVSVEDQLTPRFQDAQPAQLNPITEKIRKGVDIGKSAPGILFRTGRFLMTADHQLRQLGKNGVHLARLFFLNVGEGGQLRNVLSGAPIRGGFFFRVTHFRNQYWADFMNARTGNGDRRIRDYFAKKPWYKPHAEIHEDYKQEVAEGMAELLEKKIGEPLTNPFAQAVGGFFEQFYKGYLKRALPTIGHIPDYVPTQIKLPSLLDRKSEFIEIAVRYKFKEFYDDLISIRERTGKVLTGDQLDKARESLLNSAREHVHKVVESAERGDGIAELALNLDEENYGPGFSNRRERKFFANKDMVAELSQKGFLETDASRMVFNYIGSAVKRAEFERTFGGYREMEGIKTPNKADSAFDRQQTREALSRYYFWNVLGLDYFDDLSKKRFGASRMIGVYRQIRNSTNPTIKAAKQKQLDTWFYGLSMEEQKAWLEFTEMFNATSDRYSNAMLNELKRRGTIKEVDGKLYSYSTNAGLMDLFSAIGAEGSNPNADLSRAAERKTYERESGVQNQLAAKQAVRGYLGQLGLNMPRDVHQAMSTMMAYQSILILLFSTLSSLPDIAGGILRNRDAAGMYQAMKTTMGVVMKQVTDRQGYNDLVKQVESIGLVGQRISQQVLQELYGSAYTSAKAQSALDYLFTINQQERWTDFTRIVNYEVAKVSIKRWVELSKADDPKAKQYLKELNLDPSVYEKWDGEAVTLNDEVKLAKLEADDPDGQEYKDFKAVMDARKSVQDAHIRFVEESVVRPNAAHRPTWASDPRFMLLWHLKSFFYSYGKIIVKPFLMHMHNEAAKQAKGARGAQKFYLYGQEISVQSLPMLIAAVTLFGLAAIGWEAKELIQYRMWGKKGLSDDMDWDKYVLELSSRSGVWGPVELATGLFWGYGDVDRREARLMGPTADYMLTMTSTDITLGAKAMRATPVLNQLTGLKEVLSE